MMAKLTYKSSNSPIGKPFISIVEPCECDIFMSDNMVWLGFVTLKWQPPAN